MQEALADKIEKELAKNAEVIDRELAKKQDRQIRETICFHSWMRENGKAPNTPLLLFRILHRKWQPLCAPYSL